MKDAEATIFVSLGETLGRLGTMVDELAIRGDGLFKETEDAVALAREKVEEATGEVGGVLDGFEQGLTAASGAARTQLETSNSNLDEAIVEARQLIAAIEEASENVDELAGTLREATEECEASVRESADNAEKAAAELTDLIGVAKDSAVDLAGSLESEARDLGQLSERSIQDLIENLSSDGVEAGVSAGQFADAVDLRRGVLVGLLPTGITGAIVDATESTDRHAEMVLAISEAGGNLQSGVISDAENVIKKGEGVIDLLESIRPVLDTLRKLA